jgi:hypothetical protein
MCGIPAKKSRDRLDNGLLIDVPGIPKKRKKLAKKEGQNNDPQRPPILPIGTPQRTPTPLKLKIATDPAIPVALRRGLFSPVKA